MFTFDSRKPLVLGLGCDAVADDGFGPAVAAALKADPLVRARADVACLTWSGHPLLELLQDRPRVLILDVVRTGEVAPGTLRTFAADLAVRTYNTLGRGSVCISHALNLGRHLGYVMPRRVEVMACEAQDLETAAAGLTCPVAEAVPRAVRLVRNWLEPPEKPFLPLRERRGSGSRAWHANR